MSDNFKRTISARDNHIVVKQQNKVEFVPLETYNNGTVYIVINNISSIEEHETINEKYTSVTMNSGDRHTVKCPVEAIWMMLDDE